MRIAKILILLALPGFVSCQAGFLTAGAPLLLDEYPGAAAAYSVHQINTGYGGSAIQVRRASDNATADIGFDNGELNIGQIINHCSGTDCFVSIWYDQSGNGRDVSEIDSLARQPKIYDSSTGIIYDNGKPALNFDGINDVLFMQDTSGFSTTSLSFFAVLKQITFPNQFITQLEFNSVYIHAPYLLPGQFSFYNTRPIIRTNPNISLNTRYLLSWSDSNGGSADFYKNSVLTATYTGGNYPNTNIFRVFIGANRSLNTPTNANYQTVVFYPTNQNRSGIETNLNNFFLIY